MLTYQDLLAVNEKKGDTERIDFARRVIEEHKQSELYKIAQIGDEYDRKENRAITDFVRLIYRVDGAAVPDNIGSNYRLASGFFDRFLTQEVQTLLGNGVTFKEKGVKEKLGTTFDNVVSRIARYSLSAGLSFGFWDRDKLLSFPVYDKNGACFAPLVDEETGAFSAGVRFWQLDTNKPLYGTLYEPDGLTAMVWRPGEKGAILKPKQAYKTGTIASPAERAEGNVIAYGENYPAFPIIPLWGNPKHQSEIVGLKGNIDCYDLIKSGFANSVDEASYIYWTINNAGGMTDNDLVQFIEHMKTIKAAVVSDQGASAQAHSIEAPYNSREALLNRLEDDLFRDAMAVNTDKISAGNVTATQIEAAYDAHNSKVDQFEYCVLDFIQGILTVAGLSGTPTFTRSQVSNKTEQINNIIAGAQFTGNEYAVRKILEINGDGDMADEIIKSHAAEFNSDAAMVSMGVMNTWEFRARHMNEDEATAKANLPGSQDLMAGLVEDDTENNPLPGGDNA